MQEASGVYTLRYRWTKNGFTGPKRFRDFQETVPSAVFPPVLIFVHSCLLALMFSFVPLYQPSFFLFYPTSLISNFLSSPPSSLSATILPFCLPISLPCLYARCFSYILLAWVLFSLSVLLSFLSFLPFFHKPSSLLSTFLSSSVVCFFFVFCFFAEGGAGGVTVFRIQ